MRQAAAGRAGDHSEGRRARPVGEGPAEVRLQLPPSFSSMTLCWKANVNDRDVWSGRGDVRCNSGGNLSAGGDEPVRLQHQTTKLDFHNHRPARFLQQESTHRSNTRAKAIIMLFTCLEVVASVS
jgi:hypothetical protein